jgi:threonine/homoserine/homoserine lactone efflux protein
MTAELFTALLIFTFVMSVTPGPNNLMLLSSGVNFGFRRTVPHMLGIGIGFTVMVTAVGLGLGALLERAPLLYTALKYGGGAYMIWLAVKLALSGPLGPKGDSVGKPLTFLEAAAFQWVNPKGWVMAVSAIATYTSPLNYLQSVGIVSAVFGVVNLPCISVWALFGSAMSETLRDPKRARIFNMVMAALLVASLAPILFE